MSKEYELTKKIIKLAKEKAGVEIDTSYTLISPEGKQESIIWTWCGSGKINRKTALHKIEEPQIRQILIASQDKLGIKADKFERKNLCLTHDRQGRLTYPLFQTSPLQVLEELLEMLQNLK